MPHASRCLQRYFGTAVGKGRQAAKTEIERLNLGELTCRQGVKEVAKMCGFSSVCCAQGCLCVVLVSTGAAASSSLV